MTNFNSANLVLQPGAASLFSNDSNMQRVDLQDKLNLDIFHSNLVNGQLLTTVECQQRLFNDGLMGVGNKVEQGDMINQYCDISHGFGNENNFQHISSLYEHSTCPYMHIYPCRLSKSSRFCIRKQK